jgi:transcription termination factor NusB
MKDGTLVPWKPNQEPDPLLVSMSKLEVSKKLAPKVLSEQEEIDELVKSYLKKIESEKR